jgi:hypothetical protein
MRTPNADDSPTRHQELAEAVCSGDPNRAADEVRRHLAVAVQHSMEVLEPYFRLRKATGRTFHRSDKKLRQGPLDLSQLH